MLHLLVSNGIKCAYILINSLPFVMKEVIGLNECYIIDLVHCAVVKICNENTQI